MSPESQKHIHPTSRILPWANVDGESEEAAARAALDSDYTSHYF